MVVLCTRDHMCWHAGLVQVHKYEAYLVCHGPTALVVGRLAECQDQDYIRTGLWPRIADVQSGVGFGQPVTIGICEI